MARRRNRLAVLHAFQDACGDIVQLVDEGNGWPARINVQLPTRLEPVDLYISQISPHARREYEYRFQNPVMQADRPIFPRPGVSVLLVGFDVRNGTPVCVAADAERRYNSDHRFSVLFNIQIVDVAAQTGWAEYLSSSDERIIAFHPSLLPGYLQMQEVTVEVSEGAVRNAIENAGFSPGASAEAIERGRQAVTRLVRDAKFTEEVSTAYGGRCALSGVNWRVVQAAHIYPVAAPGSTDTVRNGIALAPTYHALFDKHRIYVDPASYDVRLHPSLPQDHTDAANHFLSGTLQRLRLPADGTLAPDPEMFRRRYEMFGEAYRWAV